MWNSEDWLKHVLNADGRRLEVYGDEFCIVQDEFVAASAKNLYDLYEAWNNR